MLAGRVKLLAVLVLYRCSLRDSATWKSIHSQVNDALTPVADFHLLVCMNGTDEVSAEFTPDWVEFASVRDNHGLAWAYNYGLQQALQYGADWLLTLDQDTKLPEDFLLKMSQRAQLLSENAQVAAIVPQLVSESGRVHSPVVAGKLRERPVQVGFTGLIEGDVRPFNSAALTRVSALRSIGGYDRRFWLDYLDHTVFRTLYEHGFSIWIEGALQVKHHLSLHDGRAGITEERFYHFAAAEAAFRDLHASWAEGAVFTAWLMGRAVRQKWRGDPRYFLRTTLYVLRQRLFLSRKERLRRWELEVAPMSSVPQIQERTATTGVTP